MLTVRCVSAGVLAWPRGGGAGSGAGRFFRGVIGRLRKRLTGWGRGVISAALPGGGGLSGGGLIDK
jgi:hypothetical protein